jgi:hypothetical protein
MSNLAFGDLKHEDVMRCVSSGSQAVGGDHVSEDAKNELPEVRLYDCAPSSTFVPEIELSLVPEWLVSEIDDVRRGHLHFHSLLAKRDHLHWLEPERSRFRSCRSQISSLNFQ